MADLKGAYKIINSALDELKKRVGIVEPRFNEFILEWVSKFDTSSGNIVKSKRNKDRLKKFQDAVERYLISSGYNKMVNEFLVNFDDLADNQRSVQKELNGIKITADFLNPYKRWGIQTTINNMQGQGLDIAIVQQLTDQMFASVYQGGSLRDLLKAMELQLQTTDERSGLVTKLVTQSGRDVLGQYNGKVNEAVRKTYKMDGILYVGSLVKDSRPQCERWVGPGEFGVNGLLAFENLPKEISWALDNGTGFIKDTTPETFCQNRGGYSCRHDAYPVRLENYK